MATSRDSACTDLMKYAIVIQSNKKRKRRHNRKTKSQPNSTPKENPKKTPKKALMVLGPKLFDRPINFGAFTWMLNPTMNRGCQQLPPLPAAIIHKILVFHCGFTRASQYNTDSGIPFDVYLPPINEKFVIEANESHRARQAQLNDHSRKKKDRVDDYDGLSGHGRYNRWNCQHYYSDDSDSDSDAFDDWQDKVDTMTHRTGQFTVASGYQFHFDNCECESCLDADAHGQADEEDHD